MAKLKIQCPAVEDFLGAYELDGRDDSLSARELILGLKEEKLSETGMEPAELIDRFESFVRPFVAFPESSPSDLAGMTIRGGVDKSGAAERVSLTLAPGDVVCVVGPTGSGKSRLLEDIECMAQGDTPTRRIIEVNGCPVDEERRFAADRKLTAQLSQNMNFIMDLTVSEFLAMHAESRMVADPADAVERIFRTANDLAGEPFNRETPVTQLSGGQSRALMVADTAHLSPAPVILIDEIENAGVDREKALGLLIRKEKIVIMATHDPILALMAARRLVIKNGGMVQVIESSPEEKKSLEQLRKLDRRLVDFRDAIRNGAPLPRL